MEPKVVSKVPPSLGRLVRCVARGFFDPTHWMVIDTLVVNPCMKEDDLADFLKFEKKQLRALITQLKKDKFLKERIRVETEDGKSYKHNYYFINYRVFVNVIKYKLSTMRHKIEVEERISDSRASFSCPKCSKTYSDLEINMLVDPGSGLLLCSHCRSEVVEEEGGGQKRDARSLLARFNEQVEPLFVLLRDCEDLQLDHLSDPDPTDLTDRKGPGSGAKARDRGPEATGGKWSDNRSGGMFGADKTDLSVVLVAEGEEDKLPEVQVKVQPIWMTHSTVDGAAGDDSRAKAGTAKEDGEKPQDLWGKGEANEVMRTLLVHENMADLELPGPSGEISGAVGGLGESRALSGGGREQEQVDHMDTDDEDDDVVVVGGVRVPYDDVTDEMVEGMTEEEREEYVGVGKMLYERHYE